MGQVILDTSIIIDFERGILDWHAIGEPNDDYAVATVSIAEFLVGQERGETPARKARRSDVLEVILSGGRVLDYTRETAAHHARLMTVASRQGRRRGAYDIMIAAHVVETGRILVTTDRKSALDDLPGVRLRVIDH